MQSMKLFGLDPASKRNLGWAVVELSSVSDNPGVMCFKCEAGTVILPTAKEVWEVQWPLFVAVDNLIQEHEPTVAILEKTSHFAGSFITGQVSNCMGTIFAACGRNNLSVNCVAPTHVKKRLTGSGRAKKAAMKQAVTRYLTKFGLSNVKFDSEHAYDAMANVFCWLLDQEVIEEVNDE